MKKAIILWLLIYSYSCFCQNIVPNSGFETFSSCPTNQGQLYKSPPWFTANTGTPDYFNICSSFPSNVNIPNNTWGYQWPKSGNAYTGIVAYSVWSDYREYIEVQLLSSLVANKHYCIGFHVSFGNNSSYAVNKIGLAISSDSILGYNNLALLNPPVINSPGNLITDTINWMLITGYYLATGGEKYIAIGNFNNDGNTSAISWPGTSGEAYYYVDDVFVTLCDSCPNGGPPTAKFSAQRIDSAKVSFSNDAVGQSNSWHWNFGDGDTSNIENPVHVFDSIGEYDITFVACDMWCCDTIKLRVDISKLSYVGVVELAGVSIGRLYPNPTDGAMFVDYFLKDNQQAVFEISDLFGKVFFRTNLRHGKQTLIINANAIPNGVFFYKTILNDVTLQTEKIVVFR